MKASEARTIVRRKRDLLENIWNIIRKAAENNQTRIDNIFENMYLTTADLEWLEEQLIENEYTVYVDSETGECDVVWGL